MDGLVATRPRRVVEARYAGLLALTAFAYVLCNHLGGVPGGFGTAPRGTRVADWIDLVTPYLVLFPALLTLLAAAPSRRALLCFALGSWLYADGHGMHLSANSVGNSPGYHDPPRTANLWDEYVGHWVWYAGVAVVAMTLVATMSSRPRPQHRVAWVAWVLAVLVGVTWADDSVAGNMTWVGIAVAVAAGVWGWRHRDDLGVVLLPAGIASVVTFAGWIAL